MVGSLLEPIGAWSPGESPAAFSAEDVLRAVSRFREVAHVVREPASGRLGVGVGGSIGDARALNGSGLPLISALPSLYPEWLGDRSFCLAHGVRFPYVAGEMANGIATVRMVVAMANAGMLGMFGAGGLGLPRVEKAVDELVATLGDRLPWGVNLIHSPNEPALEERAAELFIRRGVPCISTSAFMGLTPAVVRCVAAGLRKVDGRVVRARHVMTKISRSEVARKFLAPAPADLLKVCVQRGWITEDEARLAETIPVAEDVTVEADSGGHTDNQSMVALLPAILALRDELAAKHGFTEAPRVGAAGGIGTPGAAAAAFALGASYIVTGSVNQAAVESGLSAEGRAMLAVSEIPDVIMAPAADMFELGVNVQVLKRGTMFGPRAKKLYEIYSHYPSIEALPADVRARIEKDVLHTTFDDVWADTRAFWTGRDAGEVAKAERDPKHKLALCCRWYLGKASKWAIDGEPSRRADYQIWSGPSMGAFNAWAKGSFLERPENRGVVQVALNLLEGAAAITRAQQLRSHGVPVPAAAFQFRPRVLALA